MRVLSRACFRPNGMESQHSSNRSSNRVCFWLGVVRASVRMAVRWLRSTPVCETENTQSAARSCPFGSPSGPLSSDHGLASLVPAPVGVRAATRGCACRVRRSDFSAVAGGRLRRCAVGLARGDCAANRSPCRDRGTLDTQQPPLRPTQLAFRQSPLARIRRSLVNLVASLCEGLPQLASLEVRAIKQDHLRQQLSRRGVLLALPCYLGAVETPVVTCCAPRLREPAGVVPHPHCRERNAEQISRFLGGQPLRIIPTCRCRPASGFEECAVKAHTGFEPVPPP